ncbi:GMP/IMP nucleotidase [Caviibacterium pharyngocola]|uniref:HAD family hydrolase n=1 Tax=Caviibacterium pharyngocola TaxID=28159 RepID=A0A2M8RTZ2_9PAST|nr:GMP/IMP nucleotidase [Caviibacterium pharyngocola]PJG82359.1 HAD family hydrolase [Caviibacterium pharyngocola]
MTKLNWRQIDTVILDLDGTLIDLHFDHHFWRNSVPQAYAEKFGLSLAQSRELLKARYDEIEHSMNWYSIDFWAENLELPLRELLTEQGAMTKVRSDVYPFLTALKAQNKRLILLTDSHPFSLQLKLKHCDLAPHFELCLSSHQFCAPKVEQTLWKNLQARYYFEPAKTLFIDDTESVLDSAAQFGIAYTVGVENPDSTQPAKTFERHFSVNNYRTLLD